MNKFLVFMFSGQGSQYYHMASDLFNNHSGFKNQMLRLDRIVKNIIGESVIDKIYDTSKRKSDVFNRTLYTHPAIFMVEYALAKTLMEEGIVPNCVLGTSLGEFTSVAIAESMNVEDLLSCLLKQAECFEKCCQPGGMMAIIHDPNIYEMSPLLREKSEMVSVNFDSHFVISGSNNNLKLIAEHLKNKGVTFQMLPVSHAFHSSLIDQAEKEYIEFVSKKTFTTPKIPMISCLYGNSLTNIPGDYFWHIARNPIRFREAIQFLESGHNCTYMDIGPSGTLANFAKFNISNMKKESQSETFSIITLFNQDLRNLQKAKESFSI